MRVRKGEAPIKVFKFIAVQGPVSKYEIHKGLNLNYATVFYAVDELLDKRLIQVVEKSSASKNRVPVYKYDLTFEGGLVAFLLMVEEKEIEGLRRVVQRLSNFMHPVFGRWEFFIREGVEDTVINAMYFIIGANTHLIGSLLKMPKEDNTRERLRLLMELTGKPLTEITEEFTNNLQEIQKNAAKLLAEKIMRDFILSVINGAITYSSHEHEKLLKIFVKDPELRRFVEKVVNEEMNEHKMRIKLLSEAKKKFLS